MKRIVSFFLLLASYIVVLLQPRVETPVTPSHPIPLWSILCYLIVVIAAGAVVFWLNRESKTEVQLETA